MDRALIERMVGAVVLVLLLVVVAPAVLDGRREFGQESRESDNAGALRTEVIVLNSRPGDRGGDSSVADAQPVELPAVKATRAAAAEPAPVASTPRQKPGGQPEGYAVQLGSFAKKDNADQFAAGLSGEGYAVFVMAAKTAAGKVYRVNAGPRATRAEAEKLAAAIGKSGRSVLVVELGSGTGGG